MEKFNEEKRYYLNGLEDGKVKKVEVSKEIYDEYMHPLWREEAAYKREHSVKRDTNINISELDKREYLKVSSLDAIVSGGGEHHIGCYEDFAEELANVCEKKELLQILGQAIKSLEDGEQELIKELFFVGISEREYERRYNVPRRTVSYRKNKIMNKLKKYIGK